MEVFYSKRDWWATVLVWGIALATWGAGLILLVGEDAVGHRLLPAAIMFLSGYAAPWFWLTTRYRISATSLHLHSGIFHKELRLSDIQRVSYTRKGRGMSYAFSQDVLQIDVEGSSLGYRVSPMDRRGFVAALGRRCDHLRAHGEGLIPLS